MDGISDAVMAPQSECGTGKTLELLKLAVVRQSDTFQNPGPRQRVDGNHSIFCDRNSDASTIRENPSMRRSDNMGGNGSIGPDARPGGGGRGAPRGGSSGGRRRGRRRRGTRRRGGPRRLHQPWPRPRRRRPREPRAAPRLMAHGIHRMAGTGR